MLLEFKYNLVIEEQGICTNSKTVICILVWHLCGITIRVLVNSRVNGTLFMANIL